MKKRVLAAVLLLFITASIPFLTVSIAQLEIWKIIRGLNELGYTAVMEATEYPGETDKAVPFSADAACEIQLAPGNGTLKILAYNSARQLEAGMRERVDYWMSPKAVNPVMTTAYVYQTRRALIWYQPGAASSEDPVRDYLNNTAQPAESYIQPTKAEQEVRAILHDLQNKGARRNLRSLPEKELSLRKPSVPRRFSREKGPFYFMNTTPRNSGKRERKNGGIFTQPYPTV